MVYEFDFDGETIVEGDGETTDVVVPGEPSGNQSGVDVPGLLEAQGQTWLRGGFNLDFAVGPEDLSLPITEATSTVASNFLPGWRYIQSSNSAITTTQARDTRWSSGSNLRFTFASGASTDEAYMEQLLPVRGAYREEGGDVFNFWTVASSSAFSMTLERQYLTVDGVLTGPAVRFSTTPGTTPRKAFLFGANAPSDARVLRLRLIAARASGTGAGSIDVADGHRYSLPPFGVWLPDLVTPANLPALIQQQDGVVIIGALEGLYTGNYLELENNDNSVREQTAQLYSDVTKKGTAWTDVGTLVVPVVNGRKYGWEAHGYFTCANTATGIGIGFNHPGGTARQFSETAGETSAAVLVYAQNGAVDNNAGISTIDVADAPRFWRRTGTYECTANGSFAIRYQRSGTSANVTIYGGATLRMWSAEF